MKPIIISLSGLMFYFLLACSTVQSDSTYSAMYFHSQVRDASVCSMQLNPDKSISFSRQVSNPAATCPDAFAWKQFLEAIQDNFWTQWANDETVWVENPKPLCGSEYSTDCCFVNPGKIPQVGYRNPVGKVYPPADVGAQGSNCPYIPGDYGASHETIFAGGKPVTSHNTTFLRTQDTAHIARQREVEVVYRNDSFVRYTTHNELYSKAGLAKLFTRVSAESSHSIPYRPVGQGVSFPPDAVMFKVDWIPQATMLELGYISDHDNNPATPPQNAKNPYITMKIKASTDQGKTYQQDLYYLASITGASKALPNWHWYAFEHVNNPGRCDYTGCNDSYGYSTLVTTADPNNPKKSIQFASNFITPHTIDDQLKDNQQLFDLAKPYPSGNISAGLSRLFKDLKIAGASSAANSDTPTINDPAWHSYRLKGTQTDYYNKDGYPTIVGASITEGGFVNTASCMSCHVQASVNAQGALGVAGVGATGRLNLSGIGTVVNGHPENADYFDRGTTNQRAVQVDFVWGVLFAQ